jgi:hypothetical protein
MMNAQTIHSLHACQYISLVHVHRLLALGGCKSQWIGAFGAGTTNNIHLCECTTFGTWYMVLLQASAQNPTASPGIGLCENSNLVSQKAVPSSTGLSQKPERRNRLCPSSINCGCTNNTPKLNARGQHSVANEFEYEAKLPIHYVGAKE